MATKWEKTQYAGVRLRRHENRKHGVKFDQYFSIRYQIDGKPIEEGLGWASEGMTAKKASDIRAELKASAKKGEAVSLRERRKEKAKKDDLEKSLDDVIKLFIKAQKKTLRNKTVLYYQAGLDKAAAFVPVPGAGKLKEWKLSEIDRRYLASLVEETADDSISVAAQIRASLSALFTWAVQSPREYIPTNIIRDIKPPKKSASRNRHLTDIEAGELWRALDQNDDDDKTFSRLLRFVLLTGCRLSEALGLSTAEIDGEWWEIPASRSKGKRPHRVFLTPATLAQIKGYGLHPFKSNRQNGVFDASSISRYLKRVKYFGLAKFTSHDLRRTTGTGLAKLGYNLETISAVLGHKLQGVTAEHYIKHSYDNEKKEALTVWADHLLTCAKGEEKIATIIPLSPKRA